MKRVIMMLSGALLLAGCSDAPIQTVPLFKVEQRQFDIKIPAFGELEAAESRKIVVPGRTPMMIEWLAEENTQVSKGDVVARFDAEQLQLDARKEELAMLLLDRDMRSREAEKNKQQNELDSEQTYVGKEFEFVDQFAIDDLRLYSKLEIIDTLSNRDYLGAKDQYIDWKQGSIEQQSQSALDELSIKRQGHESKFERHQQALSQLEVYAPYDGILLYEKNFRGERPAVGQTVFPGSTVAKIPNLDQMQAKVFVLDKDAIGLQQGQAATVTLQAHPERVFEGTIKSVSGFSRTIERGNPVKYFEVVISINQSDPVLQSGLKVDALVEVQGQQQGVVIPIQAIFNEQGNNYVYVKTLSGFERRDVTTDTKNLYFVEIVKGLNEGDEIALSEPESL